MLAEISATTVVKEGTAIFIVLICNMGTLEVFSIDRNGLEQL